MEILISGDVYISSNVKTDNLISDDLKLMFKSADLNIVNLESPVTKDVKENRITKTGPHLNGNKKTFSILTKINVNLVTLANNHIMDYGKDGLKDTLLACSENNISYVGAGLSNKEILKPFIFEKNDIKVGILNFAENEWSSAENNEVGANPLDIIENVKSIKALRKLVDYVILIIHGGHEYYHLPSPRMTKLYRFYSENGVDAIVGHHTHCIGGHELYNECPIFYSLGNMIFTKPSPYKSWYFGLTLKLTIIKGQRIKWELIPIKQNEKSFKLSILKNREKKEVLFKIDSLSEIITNKESLRKKWEVFVNEKEDSIFHVFSPINLLPGRYIRGALKRIGLNKLLMRNRYIVPILNQIRCEAHYDLSRSVLKNKINEDSDT